MSLNHDPIEEQIGENRIKIGNEIRLAREKKGLSQEQLAEMINIKSATIAKIEKGRFSISVDYLARFSILLDHEFRVVEKQK